MTQKYVVYVDDVEIGVFDDSKVAEEFRKSVGGIVKLRNTDIVDIPVFRRATQ